MRGSLRRSAANGDAYFFPGASNFRVVRPGLGRHCARGSVYFL